MLKFIKGSQKAATPIKIIARVTPSDRTEKVMILTVDTSKKLDKIKDMNSVGQGPIGGGIGFNSFREFHYLKEINVPYVRLHDSGGVYGGGRFVDVPNIFRDFDADENDPANYDFAFTDAYLKAIVDAGAEPYYRLGVTIENHAEIRSYRIDPPKDYEKWARICEHIIMHYNEGWADGYHYGIKYWEIWNETDDGERVSQMWNGTAEDYYRLYDVASKHLKSRFPSIKIGGYAATGFYAVTDTPEELAAEPRHTYFMNFFHGFMRYIKEHGSPIDFFSWHSYRQPEDVITHAKWVREQLIAYGYGDIESHLNEWNPTPKNRGTGKHAADVAAIMLGSQNVGVDQLVFYDARLQGSIYAGFFNPATYPITPCHAYYTFAAFASLYRLGTQVELSGEEKGVYAVAASNGKKHSVMISNISGEDKPLAIEGADLSDARWYIIDDQRLLSWSPALERIPNNSVVLVEF